MARKNHTTNLTELLLQCMTQPDACRNGHATNSCLSATGCQKISPASTVSKDSWIETEVETKLSMQSYMNCLDEDLSKQPGLKQPPIAELHPTCCSV